MAGLLAALDWPTFLVAMALIELTPGPNMGWLAALSAQRGRRAGMLAVAGITLGLTVQVIAAATGLSALTDRFPALYQLLRWSGVAFMVYLAWTAWAEGASVEDTPLSARRAFRRGFVSNVLNPKALVFYVVVIGQFIAPEAAPVWLQTVTLGAIHVAIAAAVHSAIVMLGAWGGTLLEVF